MQLSRFTSLFHLFLLNKHKNNTKWNKTKQKRLTKRNTGQSSLQLTWIYGSKISSLHYGDDGESKLRDPYATPPPIALIYSTIWISIFTERNTSLSILLLLPSFPLTSAHLSSFILWIGSYQDNAFFTSYIKSDYKYKTITMSTMSIKTVNMLKEKYFHT